MKKIIITGSPCAGKTTLVDSLKERGYKTIPEADTIIVQDLKKKIGTEQAGKWLLANYYKFKQKVGEKQLELLQQNESSNDEIIFCDRSAICYISFCHLRNSDIPQIIYDLAENEKSSYVFFLEELFVFDERKDTGRVMKEEEAKKLSGLIINEYKKRGFNPIIVPVLHNEKDKNTALRIKYILERVL